MKSYLDSALLQKLRDLDGDVLTAVQVVVS